MLSTLQTPSRAHPRFAMPDGAFKLQSLGRELDEVHAARLDFDAREPDGDDPLYDRHWDLRAAINGIEALDLDDLQVKARALAYAFHYDPPGLCHSSGSAKHLARSLGADLLRLANDGSEPIHQAIAALHDLPADEVPSC